jgi:hypothetical protein
MFGATDRTVRRRLSVYRSNPDIVALLPRQKGQRLGNRRLKPDSERPLGEVIDVWAARSALLVIFAGRINRHHLDVIEYFHEENRMLKEHF